MSNSPKLYFIKNQEGKFYNAKERKYYSEIINANYELSKTSVKMIIKLDRFAGCEVHTITADDFMVLMATATTDAVLSGEYFARNLFRIAFKLPTVSHVNKTMYKKCKQAIEALAPFTKMQQEFLDKEEDSTDAAQGHYQEFLHEMAKVQMHEMPEVVAVLKTYHLDRASILGVTKKVLNNKKLAS